MQQTENRAADDIFRLNSSLPGTKLLGVVMNIIRTAAPGRGFPRTGVPDPAPPPSKGVRESDMKPTSQLLWTSPGLDCSLSSELSCALTATLQFYQFFSQGFIQECCIMVGDTCKNVCVTE